MQRYWVSWISGNYADEGCTAPPFQFFVSGYIDRLGDDERDDCTLCAMFDAASEDLIWWMIREYFPDMQRRFCNPVDADWLPGDRFRDATAFKIAA